jgi:MinD-like ATPase involved in chromosome partitioning or flagellar assembly
MSEGGGKVIGVVSVKGGVGKTTTVSNLGVILTREHKLSCVAVDGNISVPNLGLHLDMAAAENTLQDVIEKKGQRSWMQSTYTLPVCMSFRVPCPRPR